MQRYAGQPLPPQPRIAVVTNDAIGNFVVTTPLLRLLRETHRPRQLNVFGGHRTHELAAASTLIDEPYPLHGTEPAEAFARMAREAYDLVINVENTPVAKAAAAVLAGVEGFVCGPSLGPGGRADLPFADDERGQLWADKAWIAADLTERYPFLKSPFIGEIFCRLAYLEGETPTYEVPSVDPIIEAPEVVIAMSASLPEKLWPLEAWAGVLEGLRSDARSVGLVGAPPARQGRYWQGASAEDEIVEMGLARDLRGFGSLPQVVGLLARARLVLTLDNGILHLTAATGVPIVGLFRHGIHRLWCPPNAPIEVLTPGLEDLPVSAIAAEQVAHAVRAVLDRGD